jgi:hypothetical protein
MGFPKACGWLVSGYARTNPNEDFAESFEDYFLYLGGLASSSSPQILGIPGKKAFLDNMVAALSW